MASFLSNFKKSKKDDVEEESSSSSPKLLRPITMEEAKLLIDMTEYLASSALDEEGLYRKSGPNSERKDLIELIKDGIMPELDIYSVHSTATAIKHALRELYAPLMGYENHEALVGALRKSSGVDAMNVYYDIIRSLPPPNRVLLEALLEHLATVALSTATNMSIKNLSLTVGVNLTRTSEATGTSSKELDDQSSVANFLLVNMTEWNYTAPFNSKPSPAKQVAIKVSWKLKHAQFSEKQLQTLFSKFGKIEMVGINKKGNRAIVMFQSEVDAIKALSIDHEHLKVELKNPSGTSPSKPMTDVEDSSNGSAVVVASLSPTSGYDATHFLNNATPPPPAHVESSNTDEESMQVQDYDSPLSPLHQEQIIIKNESKIPAVVEEAQGSSTEPIEYEEETSPKEVAVVNTSAEPAVLPIEETPPVVKKPMQEKPMIKQEVENNIVTELKSENGGLKNKFHEILQIVRLSKDVLDANEKEAVQGIGEIVKQLYQKIVEAVKEEDDYTVRSSSSAVLDIIRIESLEKSRTLTAELQAMRELMRIQSSTHEAEVSEWSAELTTAKVARSEAEKLLVSVRTDLRKCRTQLACQVAGSATLQRERSTLQEQVTTLQSEAAVLKSEAVKLRAQLQEAQHVASETQQRLQVLREQTPAVVFQTPEPTTSTTTITEEKEVIPGFSAVKSLSNYKVDMASHLSHQIQQTKAALECMAINDTAGRQIALQQKELGTLLHQLSSSEEGIEQSMAESKAELSKLTESNTMKYSPKSDSYSDWLDSFKASNNKLASPTIPNSSSARIHPFPATSNRTSIDVANDSMRAFRTALA